MNCEKIAAQLGILFYRKAKDIGLQASFLLGIILKEHIFSFAENCAVNRNFYAPFLYSAQF